MGDQRQEYRRQRPRQQQLPDLYFVTLVVVGVCSVFLLLPFLLVALPVFISLDLSKPSSITEWAIVLLTLVIVLVSALQWDAMRRTLRVTRETNALTLRPWLVIENIELVELDPYPRTDDESYFRVVVKNAGRLPAVSVTAFFAAVLIPGTDPAPETQPSSFGPEGVVIAADEVRRIAFFVNRLTRDRLRALRSGELHLFLSVRLTYTDALGTPGETTQEAHYVRPKEGREETVFLDRDGRSMA